MYIIVVIAALLGGMAQKCADVLIKKFEPEYSFTMKIRRWYGHYIIAVAVNVGCALVAYSVWGSGAAALLAIIFVTCLLCLTIIDFATYLLPDIITYPLIVAGVVINYFGIFTNLEASLIGAVAGFGSFWLINAVFRLLRGKNGMGVGDFKLFAAIGAWLGWPLLPLVMVLASCTGVVAAIVLMVVRRGYVNKIPFGPYLTVGAVIALFHGTQLAAFLFAA